MQRQAMGVALHIVLLPFLNYCIAQLIHTMPTFRRLFFACNLTMLLLGAGVEDCRVYGCLVYAGTNDYAAMAIKHILAIKQTLAIKHTLAVKVSAANNHTADQALALLNR